jgi:hypothetical protein
VLANAPVVFFSMFMRSNERASGYTKVQKRENASITNELGVAGLDAHLRETGA